MNFIHLQTSKIQLFDIQIMKNFWSFILTGNFLFWFWEYKLSTVTHAGAPQLVKSQSDCLKFFLAKLLAKEGFWLVEKKFVFKCDRGIYSVFSAHRKCTISSLFWKTFHSCTFSPQLTIMEIKAFFYSTTHQCGNFRIFLSLRFNVKSILEKYVFKKCIKVQIQTL